MLKKIFLILFLTIVYIGNSFAQKLYIWDPPQIEVSKRNGFHKEKTVYIAVNDGRLPSKKVKTNTTSENVVQSFITAIQSAYPNVKFAIKDNYFEKDTTKMPLINLTISAYQAGFGTEVSTGIGVIGGNIGLAVFPQGKCNAITALYCDVVDGEKKVSKDIHSVSSRDNI